MDNVFLRHEAHEVLDRRERLLLPIDEHLVSENPWLEAARRKNKSISKRGVTRMPQNSRASELSSSADRAS